MNEVKSGNGFHLAAGFLHQNSGMISERFQIAPGTVSSEVFCETSTERPEINSLFYCTLGKNFLSPLLFILTPE